MEEQSMIRHIYDTINGSSAIQEINLLFQIVTGWNSPVLKLMKTFRINYYPPTPLQAACLRETSVLF